MDYIHIKSLEKYHPGYRDRELKWAKLFFTMAQGDPEFELVKNEIDKWRFAAMICLELEAKKPLPNTNDYWIKKFDIRKRPMSLTLQMIHNFIEVVTQDCESTPTEKKYREDKEDKNKIYVDFEKSTIDAWNDFCNKYPTLSKIKEISEGRRIKLKKRFTKKSFKDFSAILKVIKEQPFLMGENDRKWKVTFDWLIENDTNYLKALELRYKEKPHKEDDVKSADPDCQVCAGTGWDESGEGKKICRCRLRK